MRRLYLSIYLGFLGILLAITVAAALLGSLVRGAEAPYAPFVTGLAELVAETLSADPSKHPIDEQLRARSHELHVELALWDANRTPIAAVGGNWSPPPLETRGPIARSPRRGPPVMHVRLADGRWLSFRLPHRRGAHAAFLVSLIGVAALVALGAYPVARRIARRLEQVRTGMEAFGAGDLESRVVVRGKDEVAAVARSFNQAADRVVSLIQAERRMVASASHELRSPLARLRLALELVGARPDERWLEEASRDVDELDELVGDLLLASRLDAAESDHADPLVDLAAIVAEECGRVGVAVDFSPVTLRGDAKALRRLVRNLLDNAVRHGGQEISVALERSEPSGAVLRIADRGPGVPDALRERIFEPFYRPAGHAEGERGGVGLGLALARQVARYHGGDIRCAPRPGGGSLFVVSLPGRGPEKEAGASSAPSGRAR